MWETGQPLHAFDGDLLRGEKEGLPPKIVVRTAGEGTREADLEADVKYLTSVWDDIQFRKENASAPAVLYRYLIPY